VLLAEGFDRGDEVGGGRRLGADGVESGEECRNIGFGAIILHGGRDGGARIG
jgi:hypothetical protein